VPVRSTDGVSDKFLPSPLCYNTLERLSTGGTVGKGGCTPGTQRAYYGAAALRVAMWLQTWRAKGQLRAEVLRSKINSLRSGRLGGCAAVTVTDIATGYLACDGERR
jgi:hypothetical protein